MCSIAGINKPKLYYLLTIPNSASTSASILPHIFPIHTPLLGDLIDVIDYIQTLSHGAAHDSTQLILLADFFSTIELRGGVNILSLTLDACVGFMVALDTILIANERSTSGRHFLSSFTSPQPSP